MKKYLPIKVHQNLKRYSQKGVEEFKKAMQK